MTAAQPASASVPPKKRAKENAISTYACGHRRAGGEPPRRRIASSSPYASSSGTSPRQMRRQRAFKRSMRSRLVPRGVDTAGLADRAAVPKRDRHDDAGGDGEDVRLRAHRRRSPAGRPIPPRGRSPRRSRAARCRRPPRRAIARCSPRPFPFRTELQNPVTVYHSSPAQTNGAAEKRSRYTKVNFPINWIYCVTDPHFSFPPKS